MATTQQALADDDWHVIVPAIRGGASVMDSVFGDQEAAGADGHDGKAGASSHLSARQAFEKFCGA